MHEQEHEHGRRHEQEQEQEQEQVPVYRIFPLNQWVEISSRT